MAKTESAMIRAYKRALQKDKLALKKIEEAIELLVDAGEDATVGALKGLKKDIENKIAELEKAVSRMFK
jgi:tRNA U34 5-carboxymethylaminomethyl modifying GTPase MnmE/TrmE